MFLSTNGVCTKTLSYWVVGWVQGLTNCKMNEIRLGILCINYDGTSSVSLKKARESFKVTSSPSNTSIVGYPINGKYRAST